MLKCHVFASWSSMWSEVTVHYPIGSVQELLKEYFGGRVALAMLKVYVTSLVVQICTCEWSFDW